MKVKICLNIDRTTVFAIREYLHPKFHANNGKCSKTAETIVQNTLESILRKVDVKVNCIENELPEFKSYIDSKITEETEEDEDEK